MKPYRPLLPIIFIAVVTLVACFAQKPDKPELRLEKTYLEYIHEQEAIEKDPAKSEERHIRANSKISAARLCLSQLRKEFGLPVPSPSP